MRTAGGQLPTNVSQSVNWRQHPTSATVPICGRPSRGPSSPQRSCSLEPESVQLVVSNAPQRTRHHPTIEHALYPPSMPPIWRGLGSAQGRGQLGATSHVHPPLDRLNTTVEYHGFRGDNVLETIIQGAQVMECQTVSSVSLRVEIGPGESMATSSEYPATYRSSLVVLRTP